MAYCDALDPDGVKLSQQTRSRLLASLGWGGRLMHRELVVVMRGAAAGNRVDAMALCQAVGDDAVPLIAWLRTGEGAARPLEAEASFRASRRQAE